MMDEYSETDQVFVEFANHMYLRTNFWLPLGD